MATWTMWYDSVNDVWGGTCEHDNGVIDYYSAGIQGGIIYQIETQCCCIGCNNEGEPNSFPESSISDNIERLKRRPIIKSYGVTKVRLVDRKLEVPMPTEEIKKLTAEGYTGFRILKFAANDFGLQYGKVVGYAGANKIC